jgi:hypothetical protein
MTAARLAGVVDLNLFGGFSFVASGARRRASAR